MNINVSMMRDWIKCPTLAYNQYVLHRGPAKRSQALDVGTLFHEAMAARPEARVLGSELPSWEVVGDEARAAWDKHKLWLPVNAWTPPEGELTVGTEIALEWERYDGILQGRLDRLIQWNGKYWSRQWKTYTGDENDLLSLQERVRLSYHEVVYQCLAEMNGYTPWGGTILGACNKLPGYRKGSDGKGRFEITDEEREQALTTHYLFRSRTKQNEMMEDALHWMNEMTEMFRKEEEERKGINKNYDSCFGPFGKGRCPFFEVCHGAADLDGPEFVTLEDRYAK